MTLPEPSATTVVLSRRVKPGREAEFRTWIAGFQSCMAEFPGHRGGTVVPPVAGAQDEWVFVYAFDSTETLEAWLQSDVRREWLARAEPLVAAQSPARRVSGLEQWFGLPPRDEAVPPPVWKVATSVVIGLFPVTLLNLTVVGPLLQDWPLVPRALVVTVVLVALMTWVVMPLVSRLLRPWLYPRRGSDRRPTG